VVDEYLQTSVPGIYAAGDACEGFDWSSGKHAVHAIQPVAADTGRMAALNMTGSNTRYAGSMDMNVLDTLGLISTSYGRWGGVPGGDEAVLLDEDEYRYLKLQFEGEYLIGAIALGLTEHVGVLRGLIQSRTRLGAWKQRLMDNPSRLMEAYLACTQFSETA
jgi:NADPH-dependent 2,4-dienoyl-CoA reductase/sulfur reductase-like enzyme